MRPIRRRTLGVAVGLTLGWLAAGYAQGLLPGTGEPPVASAQTHEAPAPAEPHEPAAREPAHPGANESAADRSDEGAAAAEKLVPVQADIPWFKPVLWTVLGLFVAAVVLGIPALKLRGPLPPDPADTHAQDDHAHDHAHDHGQSHGH